MFEQLKNDFPTLHAKFVKGLTRIKDCRNQVEIEQFEHEIVDPMDAAWLKLSETERIDFLKKEKSCQI